MRVRTPHITIGLLLALMVSLAASGNFGARIQGIVAGKHAKPVQMMATSSPTSGTYVVKVVDGDTLDAMIDGQKTRLRLIGMDTPEIVDPRKPVQCFAKAASDKAKSMMPPGTSIRIEYDPSQGQFDKYDRTLAYVFIEEASSTEIFYNQYMIAEGYAHEYTYDLPYKYQRAFKAAEKSARIGEKGLWSPDTCNGDTTQPAQ